MRARWGRSACTLSTVVTDGWSAICWFNLMVFLESKECKTGCMADLWCLSAGNTHITVLTYCFLYIYCIAAISFIAWRPLFYDILFLYLSAPVHLHLIAAIHFAVLLLLLLYILFLTPIFFASKFLYLI